MLFGLATALLVAGCAVGPKAIETTHARYACAVLRVEEEQFLSNIVRLRYAETPWSLDVSGIAAQYEVSASAEARPFFGTESVSGPFFRSFSTILPFASLSGADRPTISLTPMDDSRTIRQFLTPITADTLVFLSQAGWPVSTILRIWADRLNGVPNWVPPSGPTRDVPSDFERFKRATELLQAAQDRELLSLYSDDRATEVSGPFPAEAMTAAATVEAAKSGYEYRPRADGKTWALYRREKRLVLRVNPAGRGGAELAELAVLLNLKPVEDRYELDVASGVTDPAKNPSEPEAVLRVTPRSTAQAFFYLANGVEVPPSHVTRGLVRMPPDGVDPTEATRGIFRIHACPGHKCKPPASAYLAVHYRDHWFYVEDGDPETKATLLLMLQLRRLDFKRQEIGGAPVLTLPIGR